MFLYKKINNLKIIPEMIYFKGIKIKVFESPFTTPVNQIFLIKKFQFYI